MYFHLKKYNLNLINQKRVIWFKISMLLSPHPVSYAEHILNAAPRLKRRGIYDNGTQADRK